MPLTISTDAIALRRFVYGQCPRCASFSDDCPVCLGLARPGVEPTDETRQAWRVRWQEDGKAVIQYTALGPILLMRGRSY